MVMVGHRSSRLESWSDRVGVGTQDSSRVSAASGQATGISQPAHQGCADARFSVFSSIQSRSVVTNSDLANRAAWLGTVARSMRRAASSADEASTPVKDEV